MGKGTRPKTALPARRADGNNRAAEQKRADSDRLGSNPAPSPPRVVTGR